jgi:L-rhamnose mutarotase
MYICALKQFCIAVLIAEKKKKENISEYIIHMYKTEDLIRAFEYDMDQLERYMISHLPISDEEKQNELRWYSEIADIIKSGSGMTSGHLEEVQDIVDDLNILHERLRETDTQYKKVLEEAQNDLDQYNKLVKDEDISEIQLCLNAVYGYLLLKMENKPISEEQKDTVDRFGAILAYLSFKYRETL